VQIAGSDQQNVALLNLESTAFLGGQDVFRHDTVASFDPVCASNHRRVDENAPCHDPILGKLNRFDRRP